MGEVKLEEVVAYHTGRGLVCADCATAEEQNDVKEHEILLRGDYQKEEVIYFCDVCGERI